MEKIEVSRAPIHWKSQIIDICDYYLNNNKIVIKYKTLIHYSHNILKTLIYFKSIP